ncbi:MAG: hypothetical protein H6707_06595 [Deltaproteobacteria bacterium]|nr:hypothetical protein [Deltaproteobacteria bacterium]
MFRLRLLTITLLCALSAPAWSNSGVPGAQLVDKKDVTPSDRSDGWVPRFKIGASVNLGTSSNVVGQTDGTTFTLGLQAEGGFDYFKGSHEWRNSLKLTEALSRSPAIKKFVKSNDALSLESTYLYAFKSLPWFGPYGQLQVDTAIFQGHAVSGDQVTYNIARTNGTTEQRVGTTLQTSDPFQPLLLREAIGFFARPYKTATHEIEFKGGFGARHYFANGTLTVKDDGGTPEIEVVELQTVHQGGPLIGAELRGKISKRGIGYTMGAEAMIPLIKSEESTKGALELTNVLFYASVSLKLVSWASLDYSLRALREAQVLDEFQVQNTLLLTFSWDLIAPPPPKK